MTIILMRTLILYLIILFALRFMGKAALSKMSPFQLIVSFMIAELASIPIESPDVSMISGITAILALLFLQVAISYLSTKWEWFKNLFGGTPSVLIDKGNINYAEMKKLRITIGDLMEQLRLCNCPSITDVDYAVMEANGNLSVIQKPDLRPLTPQDMSIKTDPEVMPSVIISDGFLYESNLRASSLTRKDLHTKLRHCGIHRIEDVFLAFCDQKSVLHIYDIDGRRQFAREGSTK